MKRYKIVVIGLLLLVNLFVSCGDEITNTERIGLSDPSFTTGVSNWIPQKLNMSTIWQADGIDWDGYNYYFVTNAQPPYKCSERFNPNSDYFQSWFGMYTVSDKADEKYVLEMGELDELKIIKLAIADQKAWLKSFAGLDIPNVYIDTNINITKEEIKIDSQDGWKISGRLVSNVDVGNNNETDVPDLFNIPKSIWEEKSFKIHKISHSRQIASGFEMTNSFFC